MKNNLLQHTLPAVFFTLLAGVLADGVVDRLVFHHWLDLHFCAMVVVLLGMRRGFWAGLFGGWWCGLMLAAVTGEHLGLSMFSLGTVGFLAGNFQHVTILGLAVLDFTLLAGLVFLERLLVIMAASLLIGGRVEIGLGGMLVSILAGGAILVIHPPAMELKQKMMADATIPLMAGARSRESGA